MFCTDFAHPMMFTLRVACDSGPGLRSSRPSDAASASSADSLPPRLPDSWATWLRSLPTAYGNERVFPPTNETPRSWPSDALSDRLGFSPLGPPFVFENSPAHQSP